MDERSDEHQTFFSRSTRFSVMQSDESRAAGVVLNTGSLTVEAMSCGASWLGPAPKHMQWGPPREARGKEAGRCGELARRGMGTGIGSFAVG